MQACAGRGVYLGVRLDERFFARDGGEMTKEKEGSEASGEDSPQLRDDIEMDKILVEIVLGRKPEDSRYHPLDEESLRWWSKVEKEVAEIHAKGGTVEIPDMFF